MNARERAAAPFESIENALKCVQLYRNIHRSCALSGARFFKNDVSDQRKRSNLCNLSS